MIVAVSDVGLALVEIGALALVLALLAGVAHRFALTAIPLYILAGLAVGEGGVASFETTEGFIELAGEIGALLLLLALGLQYTGDELRRGLRTGLLPGILNALANFTPGLVAGLLLGWGATASVLLGGATWITSSGVASKLLSDLGRLTNRETPVVLNLSVVEDLGLAVYLPVIGAVVAGSDARSSLLGVAVALVVVVTILAVALRWGQPVSVGLATLTDEALLLAVFGLTLLVGGVAQALQVSAAIGAFLVGLALSGSAQVRAAALVEPLRDLFAAIFFLSFSFAIAPGDLLDALLPALALAAATAPTKVLVGWFAARRAGIGRRGRLRAGTALIARGEFSLLIAGLGVGLGVGSDLAALVSAYVLLTTVIGPLAAKHADRVSDALERRRGEART